MAIQTIREVVADVVRRGATRPVYAKQHDRNSRFLNVHIQEDGLDIKVDPSLMVTLNVERPDQAESIIYCTVNDDGTVKVPLTSWMLECAGTLMCDISLISLDPDVAKLTTMQFNIYVEAAAVTDADIQDMPEYSVLIDLINRTGSEVLPEITEDDNGKFLSIEDGEWCLKEGTESSTPVYTGEVEVS